MERLTRLRVLREMSYRLLHFLIKENILHDFLTECINSPYCTLRIEWIEKAKENGSAINYKSLHNYTEFNQFFEFKACMTHSENFWWRKHYEYMDYYGQFQQSK